jgi:hypothetical protein
MAEATAEPLPGRPRVGAILGGGLLLIWPAWLLNGYPLLFSDTGAFLHQTLGPLMIWDKPWVYGPMLALFHWQLTLWLPALAQGVALSWLLWLAQRAVRGSVTPRAHLLLLGGVAVLTAAPWFAALLMPDILAPMVVLALWLLSGPSLSRGQAIGVGVLATLGIAAHLSDLPLALALVVLLVVLRRGQPGRWRDRWRLGLPLAAALALLLATNLVGHGHFSLSPYGDSFLLARLQADGPATRTIKAECPGRGWYLCAFDWRLPMDSDAFLWAPDSPVNRDAEGRDRFLGGALLAPEAGEIIGETLVREPFGVLGAMLGNAWRQLFMARVGDTLVADHLAANVEPRLRQGFPASEVQRYAGAMQANGLLPGLAGGFLAPHRLVLVLGGLGALLAWRRAAAWGDRERLALVLCVLVGVTVNAGATGALSAPHHRYQARIAWLLPLAAVLGMRRPRPGRPSSYADYGIVKPGALPETQPDAPSETATASTPPEAVTASAPPEAVTRKPWLHIVGRS